jgi:hypothetical protein
MERLFTVEFGPSRSNRFGKAVARAQAGPGECTEIEPGRYRVRFLLGTGVESYRGLGRLLEWVRHWRATEVYEGDEQVSVFHTKEMAWCASFQLESFGACRERFGLGVLPRCGVCPLFDAERAIRAGIPPEAPLVTDQGGDGCENDSQTYEIVSGPDLLELLNWQLPDWIDADFLYPDYPPEEWGEPEAEARPG